MEGGYRDGKEEQKREKEYADTTVGCMIVYAHG